MRRGKGLAVSPPNVVAAIVAMLSRVMLDPHFKSIQFNLEFNFASFI